MDDLIAAILDIALVVISFLSAFASSWYWIRYEDKKRRKRAALLIVGDVQSQIGVIMAIQESVAPWIEKAPTKEKLTRAFELTEAFCEFFGERIFSSTLPDLALLPPHCKNLVLSYYKIAEPVNNQVKRCVEQRDRNGFIAFCRFGLRRVLKKGYEVQLCLYQQVLDEPDAVPELEQKIKALGE